jgi:hypothetical protein
VQDAGAVWTGRGDRRRHDGGKALPSRDDDRVSGEAGLLVQHGVGRAGAEVVQADDPAGVADELRQPMGTPAPRLTRARTVGGSTCSR